MIKDFDYNLGKQQEIIIRPQWHNGNSLLEQVGGIAYTGGLIIESTNLPRLELTGFEHITLKLNRNPVPVYAAQSADLAILGYRLRYFSGTGDNRVNYASSQYDAIVAQGIALRGNIQIACILRGMPNKAVFLSFTGTASREILKQIKRFREEALPMTKKKISDFQEASMPFQAFWLTISPTPHKLEGKSGKQSEVTHPTFGFPEQFDRDYLLQRYVGADLLTRFNECIKTQLEAWIHAWDAPQDNSEIL